MSQEAIAAYVVGAVGAVIAILIGWLGVMQVRRGREEDKERALGRVEGRQDADRSERGAGRYDGNIMEALGGLKAQVADARVDIDEIRRDQVKNRNDTEAAHRVLESTINGVARDVAKSGEDILLMRHTVAQLMRRKGSQ